MSVWRQDAAITGTLEACRYVVAAAILAASDGGFQPRVPHPSDTILNRTLRSDWGEFFDCRRSTG